MEDAAWIGPHELATLRGGSYDAARMWIARQAKGGAPVREVPSRRGRPERQIARAYVLERTLTPAPQRRSPFARTTAPTPAVSSPTGHP